jgi:hypothetical protein
MASAGASAPGAPGNGMHGLYQAATQVEMEDPNGAGLEPGPGGAGQGLDLAPHDMGDLGASEVLQPPSKRARKPTAVQKIRKSYGVMPRHLKGVPQSGPTG